jgi:hypothetical protein
MGARQSLDLLGARCSPDAAGYAFSLAAALHGKGERLGARGVGGCDRDFLNILEGWMASLDYC